MRDIVPAPPAVVRNEAQTIQELFRKNVIPTYARFDVVLKRGEGSCVWDVNGKRYLDLGGGIAVCALGHAHPEITQALVEQARTARACFQSILSRVAGAAGAGTGAADRAGKGFLLQQRRRGERRPLQTGAALRQRRRPV